MLGRALCGDAYAFGLRGTDQLDGEPARHVQHVIAASGELGEREDARATIDDLPRRAGRGMPSRLTTHLRACGRRARGSGSSAVLGEHGSREARRYSNAPDATAVGDRHAVAVVGEHAHAEVVELPHRRKLFAPPALGDAARDVHRARGLPSALEHRLHDRGVVERRLGVGHAHHRRATAERGGPRTGFERLRVFATGVAEVHLDVDEAGRRRRSPPRRAAKRTRAGS